MKHVSVPRLLQALALGLFILSASFLPQHQLRAQEASDVHSLQQGSWALQYSVGSDFTLGSFLGSTISAKKHMSASHAWQLGLTVDASISSGDENNSSLDADQQILALTAHYLLYPLLTDRPTEAIHFYYGAGPKVAWNRQQQSAEGEQGDLVNTNTLWSAGLSGVIGAEWFVHRRISLSASYRTVLEYVRDSRSRETADVESTKRTENIFQLRSLGVQFGVSVYL